MTEEVREELAPVETQEIVQDDAAFEAGFNQVSGDEPVNEPEPVPVEPKVEEKPEETPEPVQAEPTVAELIAQAKAEVYQELGKVRDTMAGRWGEVNSRVQQYLTQQQSSGGSGVKLSKESMKRLSTDFPEMAEMIAEDLSEALKGVGGSPQFDQSHIDSIVAEKVKAAEDKMTKDLEKYKLSLVHDDWEEVVGGEKFRTWLGSKPLDYQEKIGNSWNAKEIAGALNSFKSETEKAQQQAQKRQERLASAVQPTQATQSANPPDESDGFLAGWKTVRGKT